MSNEAKSAATTPASNMKLWEIVIDGVVHPTLIEGETDAEANAVGASLRTGPNQMIVAREASSAKPLK